MAVVTVRDIPNDLQEFLKADAAANHRSLNKQIIVALDAYRAQKQHAGKRKRTPQEKHEAVERILESIRKNIVHDGRTVDEILGYDENGLPS